MKPIFKRLISGVTCATTLIAAIPISSAFAIEDTNLYPYVIFAGSDLDGAITINADNVCVNGNISTNGSISTSAANFNVNGSRKEHAEEPMIYFFEKLDSSFFNNENTDTYLEDYYLEEQNISINSPLEAEGDVQLVGNINISSGIKALDDIILEGNVENSNNSVVCSKTGDINIETNNVNLNGIIYAPEGCININAQNLNINGAILIADTICITCPNLNANYSTSMAEFIGIESDTDIDLDITAYGDYNSDSNSIDIKWYSTVPKGTFEIQVSDNDDVYSSLGTVVDSDSYQYEILEEFTRKYIKIVETTYYGETVESIPFIVNHSDSEYEISLLDSDNDGLPDILENTIGTDIYDVDTDKDGLSDYYEYLVTKTDPLIYDSVKSGISDAEADCDEDGINNIEEINIGTNPLSSDTDNDNLSDYDEINIFYTSPINPDSDNDEVEDGSEIKLGLDPNNPETFNYPDAEYKIKQSITRNDAILSDINTDESPFELSIDLKTNLDVEKEISIVQSGYSASIQNDAMIGASLDINISDKCNPEDIVIKYSIKDEYRTNTLNKYSGCAELNGLKRLNIFKFYEDTKMLLPIDTLFDEENNTIYAEVDELGTYCIMDMEIWLDGLEVEMTEKNTNTASFRMGYPSNIKFLSDENRSSPLDLVFMIQTEGFAYDYDFNNLSSFSSDLFEMQKQLIVQVSNYAFTNYDNVNVYIITYDSNGSKYLTSTENINCYYDYSSVKKSLDSLNYSFYYIFNVKAPFKRNVANELIFNDFKEVDNRNVYVYHFINNYTDGIYSDDIDVLDIQNIIYSYITPSDDYFYDENNNSTENIMYSKTIEQNGLYFSFYDDCYSAFTEHIDKNYRIFEEKEKKTYSIIIPNNWKTITLDAEISPDNGVDTDNDSLTDWEEVDTERLIWNEDGSFDIPTFDISEIVCHLKRFKNSDYDFLYDDLKNNTQRHYLPIITDPTLKDSDDDELMDVNDPYPLSEKNYSNILINVAEPKKAEALQRSLEYLGYFQLPEDTSYGTCGGITSAAIQLFQLNHRMFAAEKSFKFIPSDVTVDTYYIDTTTYYAIIKEAFDNGYSNYPSNLSYEFDIFDYNLDYKPQSVPLEKFNASLNPDNPIIISSTLRKNVNVSFGVGDKSLFEKDKVDIYVYDYTPIVDAMLLQGAQIFHFHHYECNCGTPNTLQPYLSYYTYSDSNKNCGLRSSDYPWMILKVKNNALFDVKTKNSWNTFINNLNANVYFYTSSFPFIFDNEVINAEILGNILFGFSGHAGGYSKSELLNGGSLYSFITSLKWDNEEDSHYTEYGYDLFSERGKKYSYLHITE